MANYKSIKQHEEEMLSVLLSKGTGFRPDMSTFINSSGRIKLRCETCNTESYRRVCDIKYIGAVCKCNKIKPVKKTKLPAQNKPLLTSQERWDKNKYAIRIHRSVPNLIPIVGTFTYRDKPMKMCCTLCNKIVIKRVSDALRGTNCGNCFGVGFKSTIPSVLYIMKIECEGVCIGYKIGITNKTAGDRSAWINKTTELTLIPIYSYKSDGKSVRYIESEIKKLIRSGGYISSEIMQDGFTETFSGEYINAVLHKLFELT
ncbi:hypothetical protein [Serratia liquefaciens]|uniref:hypothetical protein n=1 Tax=Serratia liquefaciens TaxID=614 RepID=UPI0039C6E2EA